MLLGILLLAVLIACPKLSSGKPKVQRSIYNFAQVIKCVTKRGALFYNNYGCYCGVGGSGEPVDAIDRCCQLHDLCYGLLSNGSVWSFFKTYDFQCVSGDVICNGYENDDSANALCRCDVEAARCFNSTEYPRAKPRCPALSYVEDIENIMEEFF